MNSFEVLVSQRLIEDSIIPFGLTVAAVLAIIVITVFLSAKEIKSRRVNNDRPASDNDAEMSGSDNTD